MSTSQNKMVFRFKLDFDLGFGYCKLLDFTKIDQWNGVLIKIYDFKSLKPLDDIHHLETVDYRNYLAPPSSDGG
ncbi:MAG: hypothetical protein KDD15_05260, partial [Lewinella sp.]|nr:hypothetical protein [Lewinella sp.]